MAKRISVDLSISLTIEADEEKWDEDLSQLTGVFSNHLRSSTQILKKNYKVRWAQMNVSLDEVDPQDDGPSLL